MYGRALLGSDYTLSGNPGEAIIPAGQFSVSIILNALNDNVRDVTKAAIMVVNPGPGYQLPRPSSVPRRRHRRVRRVPTSATIEILGP